MIVHIFTYIFTTYGYITNSQRDQLPDALIAQMSRQQMKSNLWHKLIGHFFVQLLTKQENIIIVANGRRKVDKKTSLSLNMKFANSSLFPQEKRHQAGMKSLESIRPLRNMSCHVWLYTFYAFGIDNHTLHYHRYKTQVIEDFRRKISQHWTTTPAKGTKCVKDDHCYFVDRTLLTNRSGRQCRKT